LTYVKLTSLTEAGLLIELALEQLRLKGDAWHYEQQDERFTDSSGSVGAFVFFCAHWEGR